MEAQSRNTAYARLKSLSVSVSTLSCIQHVMMKVRERTLDAVSVESRRRKSCSRVTLCPQKRDCVTSTHYSPQEYHSDRLYLGHGKLTGFSRLPPSQGVMMSLLEQLLESRADEQMTSVERIGRRRFDQARFVCIANELIDRNCVEVDCRLHCRSRSQKNIIRRYPDEARQQTHRA